MSTPSAPDILLEGFLYKEGGSIRTWKRRWIVLSVADYAPNKHKHTSNNTSKSHSSSSNNTNAAITSSLCYYTDKNRSRLKGEIPILPASKVTSLEDGFSGNKGCLFALVSPGYEREFLLMSAASNEEKTKWMEGIRGIIQRLQEEEEGQNDEESAEDAIRPLYLEYMSNMSTESVTDLLNDMVSESYGFITNNVKSKREFEEYVQGLQRMVPDIRWSVEEVLVQGDRVVVRCIVTGSPVGDFFHLPDLAGNKSFSISSIDIHTVENGKILSTHHTIDWIGACAQLTGSSPLSTSPLIGSGVEIALSDAQKESFRFIVRPLYLEYLSVSSPLNTNAELEGKRVDILSLDYICVCETVLSKSEFEEYVQGLQRMVPDIRWSVEEVLVQGDRVVVRCIVTGSPVGDFFHLPDLAGNKSFSISSIDIHTVENGKILSTHHTIDWMCATDQLC